MRAKVWVAIIICSLGWGTAGIATRAAFHEDVGPYTILGLRALIATAAVFAYRALRRQPWPSRRLWGLGAILGLTNYTGSALLFSTPRPGSLGCSAPTSRRSPRYGLTSSCATSR